MAIVARSGQSSGLVGRWFHMVDDSYLIQCYSWWDGSPHGGAFLVPRDQIANWTFYEDHEYMQAGL